MQKSSSKTPVNVILSVFLGLYDFYFLQNNTLILATLSFLKNNEKLWMNGYIEEKGFLTLTGC